VGGGTGLLNSNITVHVELENAKGLLTGNLVRYSGVKIGTVSDIKIKSEKQLTVTMSLDKDVQVYIKANAEAEIGATGLVGNKLINITPGIGDAPLIKNGDTIRAKPKEEITEMLSTLSTTNEKIFQITESLLQITEKINNGTGSISLLINDETLAENLKNTTRNLSATTNNIKTSTQSLNSMIAGAEEGEGNLGYLLKDNSLEIKMDLISNNLDSLLNHKIEPIIHNLESSSATIARTTIELESIIDNIDNDKGLFGTMMTDTIMAEDLKNTIHNLNEGTQKFDESMEALQHNWLLRGFFKKKAKRKAKEQKK